MTGSMQTTPNDNVRSQALRRVTWTGLFANIVLCAVKLLAGLTARSQALIADAVHSASDMVTDVALLAGEGWWTRPADSNHQYGHKRLEGFVTLFVGLSLVGAAVGIGYRAFADLRLSQAAQPGLLALLAAVFSLIVKEALYRWTMREGRRIDSPPLIANAWHHRSDGFSTLPVLLALILTVVMPHWAFMDRIGALAVCVFLMFAARRIAWPAFQQLLDVSAGREVSARIAETVMRLPEVREVHQIRTRYLGDNQMAVDLHVLVDGRMSVSEGHDISEQVKAKLLNTHTRIQDVIVHLEPLRHQRDPAKLNEP